MHYSENRGVLPIPVKREEFMYFIEMIGLLFIVKIINIYAKYDIKHFVYDQVSKKAYSIILFFLLSSVIFTFQ